MSSAAAAQPTGAPGVPAPTSDRAAGETILFAQRITAANLVAWGLLAAGFVGFFFRWFLKQHEHSFGSADWSHAYVVPLISGYVLWKRRDALARLTPRVFWPGVLPLALGATCYAFFLLGVPNHMLQGFSIVLTLAGLVLLLLGPKFVPLVAFPIAYLGFGVTVAEMVMLTITYRLQHWASAGAYVLMRIIGPLFGFTTDRAGNVLTITERSGEVIPLNVDQACSGMRMLIAFIALGAAIAFISCRLWWQRVALLLIAGPVAVLVNVLRVAFLGLASTWDAELSKGDAHMMIGVLWLVPAFLLFLGAVGALKRIVRDQPAPVLSGAKQ